MNKRNIVICGVIFLFIIGGVAGYTVARLNEKQNINDKLVIDQISEIDSKYNETVSTVTKDKTVVLPTARIKIKQYYKKCGHTVTEEYSVPEDIVNMTEGEVEKYYFGWEIKSFSDKEISIYKESSGICEEHYIVRDIDGMVTVFRKDDKDNEILAFSTEINTKYLPNDDYEKLKNSIKIVGKENLSALLEDYE